MCVTQELACHHSVIRTNASSLLPLSYVQIHYFDQNVFKVMINEMIDVLWFLRKWRFSGIYFPFSYSPPATGRSLPASCRGNVNNFHSVKGRGCLRKEFKFHLTSIKWSEQWKWTLCQLFIRDIEVEQRYVTSNSHPMKNNSGCWCYW